VVGAVKGHRRFVYEYDFGDSWQHDVVVEATWTMPTGLKFAVCVDGQNACPPEDCGGPPGYALMLEALADPSHEEHDDFLGWVGGSFDPEAFDLAAANAALQRVR
jgi:Plasmid pRiA4b ORF-3-like protein